MIRPRICFDTRTMRTARSRLFLPLLALSTLAGPATRVLGDDRLPGEVAELTDKTRAEAQVQLDVITKATGDAGKARRALLVMGPVIWPAVDNTMRLTPPDAARPHLNFLKALLLKKAEPEFEILRTRLRRKMLTGDLAGIGSELNEFRLGPKDPANAGKRLPLKVVPTKAATAMVYRSSDGSIAIAFGNDATDKKPDAPELSLTEPVAGFAAAVGGRAMPYARTSGKGCDVACEAPQGFAYAWATDGAVGKAPGGSGGDAGTATAKGGAGEFTRAGNGGAAAPDK